MSMDGDGGNESVAHQTAPAPTLNRPQPGPGFLKLRRTAQAAKGWKPVLARKRKVSAALKAYAKLVTSADKVAVRNLDLLAE